MERGGRRAKNEIFFSDVIFLVIIHGLWVYCLVVVSSSSNIFQTIGDFDDVQVQRVLKASSKVVITTGSFSSNVRDRYPYSQRSPSLKVVQSRNHRRHKQQEHD